VKICITTFASFKTQEAVKMSLVFISYAHRDGSDIAETIYETLEKAGCNPWMDVKRLKPGVDWDEEIETALDECSAVVVVITPLAVNSLSVKAEWKPALEDGKLVIPVVRKPVRVPRYLRLFQWIDVSEGKDRTDALQALVERLGCQLDPDSIRSIPVIPAASDNGGEDTDDDLPESDEQRYAIELLKQRKYLELIEWVNKIHVPVENRTRASLLGLKAVAQDALGYSQYALDDLSEAIELQPDEPELYIQRGELNVDLGNVRDAFQDFERALKLDPDLKDLINIETAAVVTYVTKVDMLPMPLPESIHGRERLVELVNNTFAANRDALLYGVGGIGKTAIATIVAGQFIERGGAVVWVNVGAASFEMLLNAIGQELERALNSSEFRQATTLEGKIEAVVKMLKLSKPLLVLDDAWNIEAMVDFFNSMAANHLPVLVTTRRTEVPPLPNVERISIEALPSDSAIELYRQSNPNETDTAAIERLCDWLNYHPLVVRLAAFHAKYLNQNAVETLNQLEKISVGSPIRAAFDLVIQQLSEPAQRVFRMIGALPMPRVTAGLMALVVDQEVETTVGILSALASRGLMGKTASPDGQEFYAIHDLTYAYAHDLLGNSSDIHEAEQRVLQAGIRYVKQKQISLPQIAVERANLLGLLERAAAFQDHDSVFSLTDGLSHFLDYMGYLQDQIKVFLKALASTRIKRDQTREIQYLRTLANAHSLMGQYQRASDYYQAALEIARELGSRADEGGILSDLGNIQANLGEFDRAIELLQQALTITRQTGQRRAEVAVLGNLGNALLGLGRVDEAIKNYELALEMRDASSQRGVSATLTNLGNAFADAGDPNNAIAYLEQALKGSQISGDRRSEAIQLNNLGIIYANMERYNLALDYYRQAGEIFREIGADNLSANVDELIKSAMNSRRLTEKDTRSISIQQNIDNISGGTVIGSQINYGAGKIQSETKVQAKAEVDKQPDKANQPLFTLQIHWWMVALAAVITLVIVAALVLIFSRPG
jgi:tetratricopeptide (TPR) repeat protein